MMTAHDSGDATIGSHDEARPVTIRVDAAQSVSGLLQRPQHATACCMLAHGAGGGAGMAHPFMAACAQALAERNVATLRYQFPYMERGSKRPDRPELAQATVSRRGRGSVAPSCPGLRWWQAAIRSAHA